MKSKNIVATSLAGVVGLALAVSARASGVGESGLEEAARSVSIAEVRSTAARVAASSARFAAAARVDGERSTIYAVRQLEPYVQVRCGQGVGLGAAVLDGPAYLDVKVPELASGVERFVLDRSQKFIIDEAFDFHIESSGGFFSDPTRVRIGRLQYEAGCFAHHVDRDITTYVPVPMAADVRADLVITLTGSCESVSNWPNGPGRSYRRPIVIELTLTRNGGDSVKLSKENGRSYKDQESCERGAP